MRTSTAAAVGILMVALWLLAGAYNLGFERGAEAMARQETCIGSAIATDATTTTILADAACSRP